MALARAAELRSHPLHLKICANSIDALGVFPNGAMSEIEAENMGSASPDVEDTRNKRKRSKNSADEELEIDINLPEPPSKKAKRKEKKSTKRPTKPGVELAASTAEGTKPSATDETTQSSLPSQKRSNFGIWIGNLPFSAANETLRDFFSKEGGIEESDITRLHIPSQQVPGPGGRKQTQNKGFAYVDFTTEAVLNAALPLSERLFKGRRVLIKNAKNFEGRPVAQKARNGVNGEAGGNRVTKGKEPTKRIFVGNLGFDVTREELSEHFGQAGEVEAVFLATFEDSGKCKGFGWVRFAEIEGAEAAVRGYILPDRAEDDVVGSEDSEVETVTEQKQRKEKKLKPRKHWINRLQGRELRCEFAEDAQTRYGKRFSGKGNKREWSTKDIYGTSTPKADMNRNEKESRDRQNEFVQQQVAMSERPRPQSRSKPTNVVREQRHDQRQKRSHLARAPQSVPSVPKANGAIVAGTGKKISFD